MTKKQDRVRMSRASEREEKALCKEVLLEITKLLDFPGGSVVKTPCLHCRGPKFDTWSGN